MKRPIKREKKGEIANRGDKSFLGDMWTSDSRYRLFGMCGSFEEYWIFGDSKEELKPDAIKHLKYGHDAHIEDKETGQIWDLKLKDRV